MIHGKGLVFAAFLFHACPQPSLSEVCHGLQKQTEPHHPTAAIHYNAVFLESFPFPFPLSNCIASFSQTTTTSFKRFSRLSEGMHSKRHFPLPSFPSPLHPTHTPHTHTHARQTTFHMFHLVAFAFLFCFSSQTHVHTDTVASGATTLAAEMTAVGFEPTPLRTGALSQRLRPLGQTVLKRIS